MKKALIALCILALVVIACGNTATQQTAPVPTSPPDYGRDNPSQEFQYRLHIMAFNPNFRVWCKSFDTETRTGNDCRIYNSIYSYETRSSISLGANDSWSKR